MPSNKKEYQRAYYVKWYANPINAKKKKANAKKHRQLSRQRNIKFVNDYKLSHPCVKCADYHPEYIEKHPVCLQFHHCKGETKEDNIANLARKMVSLARLKKEMDKCIIVCGNCHARMHEELRGD